MVYLMKLFNEAQLAIDMKKPDDHSLLAEIKKPPSGRSRWGFSSLA
ncbi:hypothetical protein C2W59_01720 [Bacillus pumilus]|nr:hypothetical protein BAT_2680 [Bacillus pumilus ATCC 7061]RAP24203.1 hypothetical protein C2W59_01720 [Bacillus pumilus]